MDINSETIPLISINLRKIEINPQPQYQRTPVWQNKKNQLLIDTILRGYDIPKIYLTESTDTNYKSEVVDGQQRLRAIWGFYNNDYALGKESETLPDGNFSGKKCEDLPINLQDKLNAYTLSVVTIKNVTKNEIEDLFLRLQKGVTLNAPEKRNAISGNMRDFIANLASHKVFNCVFKKNKRYMYADWIAHVVCLELAGRATDIKAKHLAKMYQDNKRFDINSEEAKSIIKILNFIYKSFEEETPELNVQWGFIDFYLLISLLTKEYILRDKNQEFASFYIDFEQERRAVEDPTDLIEQKDKWAEDLYNYINAFKAGGVCKNIKTRNEVYTRRLFREIINLETRDPKRSFDPNQKRVIWRKNSGKCQVCKRKVKYSDMHADHIKPYSKGGKTTIENGQTLCAKHNLAKSNK